MNLLCIDFISLTILNIFENKTGLSDLQNMTIAVMKTSNHKLEAKTTNYREYKDFANNSSGKF